MATAHQMTRQLEFAFEGMGEVCGVEGSDEVTMATEGSGINRHSVPYHRMRARMYGGVGGVGP